LLADQDFESEGVMVPFFGRPAFTPVGPARLALRRRCQMIPVFDHRLPDGRHLVEILPRLELPGDEAAATATLTEVIETQIRRFPEQWVWMHRRWRRQG
jgi:KDO2-lipid IV(A) lauroyltransferase